jgi:SAM-dependent methyltransferase
MDRYIRTVDDVLRLLDGLFAPEADRWTGDAGSSWWDSFYADRSKPVPFFVAKPDENLVSYLDRSMVTPGRALDLGCGPGRNAVHLASAGFTVDAVDLSPAAIAWAKDRARDAGTEVHFHCGDAFALTATDLGGPYDLIYDSGCFHHLPPHRRISYLALLDRSLAPGGHLPHLLRGRRDGLRAPGRGLLPALPLGRRPGLHAGVAVLDLLPPDGSGAAPHACPATRVPLFRRAFPLDGPVPS